MKHFFVICFLHAMLMANSVPLLYSKLAQELLAKQKNAMTLTSIASFKYQSDLDTFDKCVEETFQLGNSDDISHENVKKLYLKELRRCDELYTKIQYLQSNAIRESMAHDDYATFTALLGAGMANNSSLEEEVLTYYKQNRKIKKIDYAEDLMADTLLEQESRKRYDEELAAYEEYIAVMAKEEAERIRKMSEPSKRRNVLVSTVKSADGFDFIAENFNTFHVTVSLDLQNTENISVSNKLPYSFELPPKSVKKVLHVSKKDPNKEMQFQSHFSWIMGSALAQPKDILYRIPFAKGTQTHVSQGFNGSQSHQGKYAIDFAVPIGTPVKAARSGKVVAFEASNNQGSFNKSYGKFANFIIIEHKDKTLAKYYHLRQNGVAVKLGAHVKQGELIAYSGDTGYSSGPHLHFSVSKVNPNNMNTHQTLSIRFKNNGNILNTPKKGDVITVE